MRILNFGSLNIDHVYTLPHFVAPGETIAAKTFSTHFGGKGHNQSIAFARAGATIFHAGCVGPNGTDITQNLAATGVQTQFVQTVSEVTGHALIQVEDSGQNAIIVYAGANGTVTPPFVDSVLENFGPEDRLVLQNEISCLPYLLTKAAERGIPVVFNPSPFGDEIAGYPLAHVDTFAVNEIEGAALAGETEPVKICESIFRQYGAKTLLTLGANGAAYYDGNAFVFQPAINPAKVVDTTAAGDTFTGYFFTMLFNGQTPAKALKVAAAASAITISRLGAASSIPTWAEVKAATES